MDDCIAPRRDTAAVSAAPLVAPASHHAPVPVDAQWVALSRAISDFQALTADPRVSWKGKKYDGEVCAALKKILQECEACVGPAASGTRLHAAAQMVTDSLEWKAAQTAQLRSFSTLKRKRCDLPVIFARKLKIRHQLSRQRRSVPATTSALGFAAAAVEAISGACRRAASKLSSAREECEHLRRQLTRSTTAHEATREKAKRLCLEGHAFRFGYGRSPELTRAYNMYVAAARLGSAEGFACADVGVVHSSGILLEDGLVETSACAEGGFSLSAQHADATGSLSEQPSMDRNHSHPVSLHSQSSLSDSEPEQSARKQRIHSASPTRPPVCTLQRVGTPNPHDRINQARYFFEQAAHLGHPDALFRLGRMAEVGQGGFSPDYSRAVQFYRQAAEKGHAEAQVAVGYAYERGNAYTKDYGEALKWYQKAAIQGSATGLNNLASLYYRGCGCPVDYEQAATLFKKAAAVGNIHACYNLAICYEFGRGVLAEDSDRALKLYLKAAQAGHVKAAAALGMLLFKLNAAAAKPAEAYTEAARWLQMAASKEDSEATFVLGQLYETGLGLIRDPGQALACYRKAAAGEASPKVHLRLAHLLFSGQAGTHLASKKEAFKHYRVAAEEGNDPEAWNCLGLCHEEGLGSVDGIPQYADAAQCYEYAVQCESADAMCNLARLLTKGLGIPRNTERGFELLKRAACKGHLQAKFALENEGRIVPRPLLEVALGYADVADKPPAPAVKPTSPTLGKNKPKEFCVTLSSKGQMSEREDRIEKAYAQAEEYETNTATISTGKKSHTASSLHQDDSHFSSGTPLCTPRSQTESLCPDADGHAQGPLSLGRSHKSSERCTKTHRSVPVGSSSLLQKSGSSQSVRSPTTGAHDGSRPASASGPQVGKTKEKFTIRFENREHECNQDASSSSKGLHPMLSPLSPGQIACWPEYCSSLSSHALASSRPSKLFYRTLVPHARNSLAHLLLLDRWTATRTPSASVPVDENPSAALYNKVDDTTKKPVESRPGSEDLVLPKAGRENADGRRGQESVRARARHIHETTPIMHKASFVLFSS